MTEEELEEGKISKAIGTVALLAKIVVGGSLNVVDTLENVYDDVDDKKIKELIVVTSALVDKENGGQRIIPAIDKLIKRISDQDLKDDLANYGADLSTVYPSKDGGVRTEFVVQFGQDKAEVEKLALNMLEKVKASGEDVNKLGNVVVDDIEIDGDKWYVAYPENADKGYILQKKTKAM